MNKFLLIITLLFTLSNFASAQSSGNARWAALATLPGEEFSVEMPAAPKSNGFGGKNFRYAVVFENKYFFVFSDSLDKSLQTEEVLKFIKENKALGNGTTIGSITGEEFGFTDAENFHHKILTVKTKARSYIFQTVSETENDPDVERFFASIKFDKIPPEEPAPAKNESVIVSNLPDNKENKMPDNSSGSGGSGVGNGSGNSSNNIPAQTTSSNPNSQTSPLKILSKPRPNYTDWARFYQIDGIVTLRVTFLATGSIGSISPASKLPFGLTNMAINAARGIRFEPAMKEGIPINIAKAVQYSFVIY